MMSRRVLNSIVTLALAFTPLSALAEVRYSCPPGSEHPGAICFLWGAVGFGLGVAGAIGVIRRGRKDPDGNPWAHIVMATGAWFSLTALGLFFSLRCLSMCF